LLALFVIVGCWNAVAKRAGKRARKKSAEKREKNLRTQIIKHFRYQKVEIKLQVKTEERRKARARQQIFLTTRNFICIIILFFCELNACFKHRH
jgi:hypothetical protein